MNLTGRYYFWVILLAILICPGLSLYAQEGTLKGKIVDGSNKEVLAGATVFIIGTYKGALADENGEYSITGLKPGDYSIRFAYLGYAEKVYNGIQIKAGQTKILNADLNNQDVSGDVVEIVGDANIVNLESGKSEIKITGDDIREMNARDVKDVASMQMGVSQTPDGLAIRGGRVYETKYLIDGVSAKDPLAGTGFGVNLVSSSIGEMDVVTGGGDAEFGDGTSGIINSKIREGGNNVSVTGNYARDNLGFNINQGASWNTDQGSIAIGGPVPFTKKKMSFFVAGDAAFSDEYLRSYADQLHSSLFTKNDSIWAPRQDNKWSNTFKLTYAIKPGMKLTISNQHSLNINQNTRSLQVIGNNSLMTPGFQYTFSRDMDNATTYSHQSNLTVLNFKYLFKERWTMDLTGGRLFVNLRADANGLPFRPATVDQLYDPYSIVTNPVSVWNPADSVVYVFPGPGIINNGGISTLWHDHYVQEYTFKYKFTYTSKKKIHFLTLGQEHREQTYQWVDVTRPWVGAPIRVNDTLTTPSTSVGSSSDVWKASPANGGFFAQDEIRYKGIIAFVGARFEYWAPGKFVDDAVKNPNAPVTDQIRQNYMDQTAAFAGRRWKARILPKIRVSFPISDNNVLYFNYGHATLMPHPRFLYQGLDPVYQDRSFLSNLGNPNLNPEVTVSYELGLKSQITKDLALTVSAFYNDKFDYIVSRSILVKDQTGRFVEKTFFINQDYARVRGLEIGITRRAGKWLRVNLNGAYQIATGKSNSAAESALQIKQQGFVSTSREQYLAWDRPFDFKFSLIFKPDSTFKLFGKKALKNFRFFVSSTFKSGLRYTPYALTDTTATGRPFYEKLDNQPYSKIATPWFWTDVRMTRDFFWGKKGSLSLSLEIQNIFNNKNSQIINGVTGTAYKAGDPLGNEYRDPNYPDPQDRGVPPNNPARYLQPRHMLLGATFKF